MVDPKQTPLDFELHPRQLAALHTKANEVLFGGACGGGKSHLVRVACIFWCTQIPNFQAFLFRRLLPDLTLSHVEGPKGFRSLLDDWIQAGLVKMVEDEVRFLWNNSRIHFCHCQEEKDVHKYKSSEFHLFCPDEATELSESMYRFLRTRCRAIGLKVPPQYAGMFPRILATANPGGVGHAYFKRCFVDAADPMTVFRAPVEDGGQLRQFIPSRLEDNPSMNEDDPEYENRLMGMGSPEMVRAYRHGVWDAVLGAFYPEFDKWTHIIKPFDIPSHWMRFQSFDWGSYDPFAVLWWVVASEDIEVEHIDGRKGVIPADSLIIYREWYGSQQDDGGNSTDKGLGQSYYDVIQGILERDGNEDITYRVAGHDLFKHVGGPSLAENMARHGLVFRKADNDRLLGWNEIRARLKGRLGTPSIYWFNCCKDSIRTIPAMQHDPKNGEETPHKGVPDHLAEACRYGVLSRPWASTKILPPSAPRGLATMTYNELIEKENLFHRKRR